MEHDSDSIPPPEQGEGSQPPQERATIPPPEQRVAWLAVIDANCTFSEELTKVLRNEFEGLVQIEGVYEGIPSPESVERCVDFVLFDPELDEFRDMSAAIGGLMMALGKPALVAHTDAWKQKGGRLRLELLASGVMLGIRRMDFAALVLLMRLVTEGHHNPEEISKLFST